MSIQTVGPPNSCSIAILLYSRAIFYPAAAHDLACRADDAARGMKAGKGLAHRVSGGRKRTRPASRMTRSGGEWMKRFLLSQFADELEGRPDVFQAEIVFALDLFESHSAGEADDDARDRHSGARESPPCRDT